MSIIEVCGVSVRRDAEGRYSLNDLHAAAIKNGNATTSHAPAQFLRNDSVKAFISELDSDVQFCTSVVSKKGGQTKAARGSTMSKKTQKTKMSLSDFSAMRGVKKPVQDGCTYDASFEQQEAKSKEIVSKQPAQARCAPEPIKRRKPIEMFREAAEKDGWKVVEVNGHRRIAAKYAANDVLRDVYAEDYLVDGYKVFVKLPKDGVVFNLSPKEVFWEFIQEFQCIDEAKLLVLQEVLEYWEQDLGLDLGGANLEWNNSWVDVTKQIYAWRMAVTGSNKNNPPPKFEGGRDFSRLGDSQSQHAYKGGFGGHHD